MTHDKARTDGIQFLGAAMGARRIVTESCRYRNAGAWKAAAAQRVRQTAFTAADAGRSREVVLDRNTPVILATQPPSRLPSSDRFHTMRGTGLKAARTPALLTVLAATALALTGCAGWHPSPYLSTAAATVSGSPAPTATRGTAVQLDPLILSEGHISGTGTNGTISAEVAPVGDKFRISITGYRPASSANERLYLATFAYRTSCTNALHFDTGAMTTAGTQTYVRPYPWANTYQDLSMMRFVVFVPADQSWEDGCSTSGSTAVPLHWAVPAALARLHAVDHKSRDHARGRVVTQDGKPLRYVVADSDQLDQVAARFGLTPDQLLWLTPSRTHGHDGHLYAGEELNLNPTYRGILS